MDVSGILKDPAKRAEWVHGEPMQPCPQCGSYNLRHQQPIQMDAPDDLSDPKEWVRRWAQAKRGGETPLEGPVYLSCGDCLHKGPAMDCSGRTSEDVSSDPAVCAEVKRLWNGQVS